MQFLKSRTITILMCVGLLSGLLASWTPTHVVGQEIERVTIAASDGKSVNLRASPSLAGAVVRRVPEGVTLDIIGTDQQEDARTWRNVRDDQGNAGWIAAEFLAAQVNQAATPTIAPIAPPAPTDPIPQAPPPTPANATTSVTVASLPSGASRCYEAFARFGYMGDPELRVKMGMKEIGWNPFAANPMVTFILERAPKIVAGWVAVSLMRERRGYTAPTLGRWLGEGYSDSFSLAASDWDEIQSWPADSCEGAFIHNPANRDLMLLVRSLVQTSRPSDFAPPLAPYTPAETLQCSDAAKVAVTDFTWRTDRSSSLYMSGRLHNLCQYTVRASMGATIYDGRTTPGGASLARLKLAPGEVVIFTDLKSDYFVIKSVAKVDAGAGAIDCPERIC